tara:strand:- start:2207 stop:2593 length:387 start_codon:yes stop_codon:yes gene_type:complete
MATTTGHGTTLTLGTTGALITEINDVSWGDMTRNAVETTNMSTSDHRTFIPHPLSDRGSLTVEANLDDQAEGWADLIDADAETITVTFPSGTLWTCSGFLRDASFSVPLEDKMTASLTFKFTGNISVS